MTKRTFVMCKPDAVERGLVGEVVARIERKGLRLVAAELRTVPDDLAQRHYDEHKDKPFFGELVAFLTRSPVFAMVVEGPDDNTWHLCRKLIGKTKVEDAEPGSIRGDSPPPRRRTWCTARTGPNRRIGRSSSGSGTGSEARRIPVPGSVASVDQ